MFREGHKSARVCSRGSSSSGCTTLRCNFASLTNYYHRNRLWSSTRKGSPVSQWSSKDGCNTALKLLNRFLTIFKEDIWKEGIDGLVAPGRGGRNALFGKAREVIIPVCRGFHVMDVLLNNEGVNTLARNFALLNLGSYLWNMRKGRPSRECIGPTRG